MKSSISAKILRAENLATQKGASSWLTVLHIRDRDFDLNKSEIRDAVKLRYDWEVPETPSVCVCFQFGSRDGFVMQRHKDLRDLVAEMP